MEQGKEVVGVIAKEVEEEVMWTYLSKAFSAQALGDWVLDSGYGRSSSQFFDYKNCHFHGV